MLDWENLTQIELSVIGGMLTYPEQIGEVLAELVPEHFHLTSTRKLFDIIGRMHFGGAPVDAVTVRQKAGQEYEPVLNDALSRPAADLRYYSQLLRETGQLIRMQELGARINTAQSLDAATAYVEKMSAMAADKPGIKIVSASQAALDFVARQDDPIKPDYLTWGFPQLDQKLYTELGDFVIVGGYPSAGKTLLSIQFAVDLAKKYRVGYFSLETGTQKLIDRLMAHLSQVPLPKIKDRDLNDADWAALATASEQLADLHLDCIEASGMTVRDIQAVALNQRYQVVLVDYLQLVSDSGTNRYEQVTRISQGLHTMARSRGITVIALAQLSRPEKNNGKPQPPTMSSLRESGQIEQDADAIMLLWPSDPNDNSSNRILKIAKNKEGERLKMELAFDGSTQTFRPFDPAESNPSLRRPSDARKPGHQPDPDQVTFTELSGKDKDLPF